MPPELIAECKQVILGGEWFQKDIQDVEDKVLLKFNLNKVAFEHSVDHVFVKDSKILEMTKKIDDALNESWAGNLPLCTESMVPDNFTCEDCLHVYKDTTIWMLRYIINAAIDIKEAGGNCNESNMDWIIALNKLGQDSVSLQF